MNDSNQITGYDWTDKTVLIVEDEDINVIYLEELLRFTNIKIVKTYNGQDALDFINKNEQQVDVILMDIKMPVMDGFKATEEIKKIAPTIPIIAQTAHALASEKKKCFDVGCDAYLAKPLDACKLLNMINEYFLD